MSNPHLYRRFNLLRLGGIPSPKPVGGFVIGVPTKDVRTFQTENPTVAIDGVFLKLVSAEELDEVRRRLQIPLGTDLKYRFCLKSIFLGCYAGCLSGSSL